MASSPTSEMESHIDNICKKYGLSYLNHDSINIDSKIPIEDLFKVNTKVYAGHNRHEALLRIMESLVSRNATILPEAKIKEPSQTWNQEHCDPPLELPEFERQWKDAKRFIEKNVPSTTKNEVNSLMTEFLAENIHSKHSWIHRKFCITRTGHYGGEQIAKIEMEKIAGYSVTCNKRREIIEHIKYRTMVEREEFDRPTYSEC